MMAAHQRLMSDYAVQFDSQATYKATWQTVTMLHLCYIYFNIPLGSESDHL